MTERYILTKDKKIKDIERNKILSNKEILGSFNFTDLWLKQLNKFMEDRDLAFKEIKSSVNPTTEDKVKKMRRNLKELHNKYKKEFYEVNERIDRYLEELKTNKTATLF